MSPRRTFQSCGISSSCEPSASARRASAPPRSPARALAEVLADALLGARPHRPELQHLEEVAPAPDALAPVEHGTPAASAGRRARSRARTAGRSGRRGLRRECRAYAARRRCGGAAHRSRVACSRGSSVSSSWGGAAVTRSMVDRGNCAHPRDRPRAGGRSGRLRAGGARLLRRLARARRAAEAAAARGTRGLLVPRRCAGAARRGRGSVRAGAARPIRASSSPISRPSPGTCGPPASRSCRTRRSPAAERAYVADPFGNRLECARRDHAAHALA